MKKIFVISIFLFIGLLSFIPKEAYSQNLGLGIIIGQPTGLSFKYVMGFNAIDAALAYNLGNYGAIHLHGTYLFTITELMAGMTLYAGPGVRLRFWDSKWHNHYGDGGVAIALRGSFGLDYMFPQIPLGLFVEICLNLIIIPEPGFDPGAGIGGRWYF